MTDEDEIRARYWQKHKKPPERRHMGRRTKEKVFRQACGECYYCGRITYQFSAWDYRQFGDREGMSLLPVVDHKIPLAHGGADDMSNYVLSCWACNSSKGEKSEKEFREKLGSSRSNFQDLSSYVWDCGSNENTYPANARRAKGLANLARLRAMKAE